MGQEIRCTARYGTAFGRGKALLETDDLLFRGDFRLAIPYKQMTAVPAQDGWLNVSFPGGEASFAIGRYAGTWAHKILHPVSLLDKLGVRPEHSIALVDIGDAQLVADVRARADDVVEGIRKDPADIISLGVEEIGNLEQLQALREMIKKNGAIWIVSPKGRKDLKDTDVMRAGLDARLVDVKVARFSATHTASKFVFRLKDR